MPRVRVRRFRACKRKRALWKKFPVDRKVGDPVNGVDLNGLFEIGFGPSIGWSRKGGWRLGVGIGADFSEEVGFGANLSWGYNFKSESYSWGGGGTGAMPTYWGYAYAGGRYNYDTKSGTTLNGHVGTCTGMACAEAGGTMYWNTDGQFIGHTEYAKGYYGIRGVNAGVGHEWGTKGLARGSFVEGNAMALNISYSEHNGLDFGGDIDLVRYSENQDGQKTSILGGVYEFGSMELSDSWYTSNKDFADLAKALQDNDPSVYTLVSHGNAYALTDPVYGSMTAEELANILIADPFQANYKGEKTIRVLACNTGSRKDGFGQQLANSRVFNLVLAPNAQVIINWDKSAIYGTKATYHLGQDRNGKPGVFVPFMQQ